jgi:hypothetical protein
MMDQNRDKKKDYTKIGTWATIIALIIALIGLLFGEGLFWKIKKWISSRNEETFGESVSSLQNIDAGKDSTGMPTEDSVSYTSSGTIGQVRDEHDYLETVPLSDVSSIYKKYVYLSTYNASEFTLSVNVKAMSMKFGDEKREMGVCPIEDLIVSVYLIDYNSKNIVEVQTEYIGNTFSFINIPDGTYFYAVECEGCKTYLPDSPFILKRDAAKEKEKLPWIVSVEREGSFYSEACKIKLVDSIGEAQKNVETQVRVVDMKNLNPNSFVSTSVTTNDEGFLTMWKGIDGRDYYDIIEFYVINGYCVQVQDSDYIFQTVQVDESGIGIVKYWTTYKEKVIVMMGYPSIDKPWLKYYTSEAIHSLLPQKTMYEYAWENNCEGLADVAIRYFGTKITYGQFFDHVKRVAKAFTALGVKARDIIVIKMPRIEAFK